ncbi:MAG: response regulator, partial [Sutterella sp.]|nr:response regulator [Sutterella sp.]
MVRRQIRELTETQKAAVQKKALIRIVDDDDSLREALRFVLEMEGWQVADYRCADDFLRGDAPSDPGCVVMDVRMPGLTGIE